MSARETTHLTELDTVDSSAYIQCLTAKDLTKDLNSVKNHMQQNEDTHKNDCFSIQGGGTSDPDVESLAMSAYTLWQAIQGDSANDTETASNESPINELSIYDKLHLGLLHKILSLCIKNAMVLILLVVGINMTVGSSDTWSDVMVFVYLIRAEFYEYAICVGVIDMLPGILIFLHHCNTDTWSESSKCFRLFCLLLIPLQPFSLFIVHITWLINIR